MLTGVLALQSSCGSNTQPELNSASASEDDSASAFRDPAYFADSTGWDYAIDSPDFVRGNEYERGYAALDIVHGGNHRSDSGSRDTFTVSSNVPMGVNITGAALTFDDTDKSGLNHRRVVDCEVGTRVVCRYEGVHLESAALELNYKIFAPGDHEFTASIDYNGTDPDPINNVRTMIFRYVASTRYLQTLLDATEPNGLVTLPSGTYMGTLHGGDRLLTVHGADDGGTVLLSDNADVPLLEHIGTGSTFSDLEFRSSGAPVLVRSGYNITIQDSLIAPIQGAWHDLQQLFVSNSYRLLYSRVEGWGGEQGKCRSLLVAGPHYADPGSLIDNTADTASIRDSEWYVGTKPYSSNTRPSGIYIQNTVFRDNTCNNLMLEYEAKTFPFFGTAYVKNAVPSVFILNNTFVNNKGRIHFSGKSANDVQVRNNIFVAHQDPITVPRAINQSGDTRFVLARNLVWDSPFRSLVSAGVAAGPTVKVEAPDLATDPLFADRDGGDFSLATGSPAIDAGATINAYLWTDPKTGAGIMPPMQAREPISLDGLLDGKAIMDIGAFEYIP